MAGTEPKKLALEREAKARAVTQAGRTYEDQIVTSMEAVYAEVLGPDETMPPVRQIHDLDIRILDRTTDDYMAAVQTRSETEVVRREANDDAIQIAATGADEIRAFKRRTIGHHGARGLRKLGLEANPATRPNSTLRQLEHFYSVIEDETVLWPPALAGRKPLNRLEVGRGIKEVTDDLRPAVKKVTSTTKQSEEALLKKNDLEELHDARYFGVSRHIEGRLRMAGLVEIAKRLRLARRSRPKKATEETLPETDSVSSENTPAAVETEKSPGTPAPPDPAAPFDDVLIT
jgi:hypothetical protein